MGGSATRRYDVVVVGGGPAGTAASICTARDGLDTVVFDRGDASLDRCAFVETYPGFPGGVDVETLRALFVDHVRAAGGDVVAETVSEVREHADGFRVEAESGRVVVADRVVAATTLDGDYLRGIADEDELFTTHVRETGTHERVDGSYADADGRTPIDGLFFAGGLADRGDQVLLAAADGMRVGREIVHEARREFGYWEAALPHMDWLRRVPGDAADWEEERSWEEWFDYHRLPDDHDIDAARLERVKERELAFVAAARLDDAEITRRAAAGQRRLAAHLDDDALLDAVDDERLCEYVRERDLV